jgi:hypothetical protein
MLIIKVPELVLVTVPAAYPLRQHTPRNGDPVSGCGPLDWTPATLTMVVQYYIVFCPPPPSQCQQIISNFATIAS